MTVRRIGAASRRVAWAGITVVMLVQACDRAKEARQEPQSGAADTVATRVDTAPEPIPERARAVLEALKARDGARLASLVHPGKGVRFSPYGFVRADSDVVISREQVAELFADTTVRMWGHADGSGEPLRWPFSRYYNRYVYDADFAAAPVARYNQAPAHSGNTPVNIERAYPGAQWAEFHFPMIDARYEGMDWRSLWLVFERHSGEWMLTGIVHGSWTI